MDLYRNSQGKNWLSILFITLMISILSIGCGGGGGGGGGGDTPEAEATIGSEGGTIEVKDPNSPLYGVKIEIPSGALSEDTRITIIKIERPSRLPAGHISAGQFVDCGPDGTNFNVPVTLTLPYSDIDNDNIIDGTNTFEGHIRVSYYDTLVDEWVRIDGESQDPEKNVIIVELEHFTDLGPHVDSSQETPLPEVKHYRTAEIAKKAIYDWIDNDYFPIAIDYQNIARIWNWKVIYAPIVFHDQNEELEFDFKWGINISENSYYEDFSENLDLKDYREIFFEGWQYTFGDPHVNTVWVKDAVQEIDLDNSKVYVLPYSFSYYDVEAAIAKDLALFAVEATIEALFHACGIHLPPEKLIIDAYHLAYEISKHLVESNNPIVGLYPISHNGDLYKYDENGKDDRTIRVFISNHVNDISGIVHLDFVKSAWLHDPEYFFSDNGLYIYTWGTEWSLNPINQHSYKKQQLITSIESKQLPKGRYLIVIPKPKATVRIPDEYDRRVNDENCEDCFNLIAGRGYAYHVDKKSALIDLEPLITWYRDKDGDNYGNPLNFVENVSQPQGYVADSSDCDDTISTVYPGAVEICDGIDNNCNSSVDENCTAINYTSFLGTFEYSVTGNDPESCSLNTTLTVGSDSSDLDGRCDYLYIPSDQSSDLYNFVDCDGDSVSRDITISGSSIHWIETGECSGTPSPCWTWDLMINYDSSFDSGTISGTRYDEDPSICQGNITGTFSNEISGEVPEEGLVAYYPFNGNANDESDNQNSGNPYGVQKDADKFGNPDSSYYFDGINDYIDVPDQNSLDTNSNFSISVWFNTDNVEKLNPANGDMAQTVVQYGKTNADGKNNHITIRDKVLEFIVRGHGSEYQELVGTTIIENNRWYHAVLTYNGNTAILYLDGKTEDSKLVTMALDEDSGLFIGKYKNPSNNGNHYFFEGNIDNVRIYDRALSEAEIQDLINSGS